MTKKCLGKDGRWIGKRQKASAGEGIKEQKWTVADMDEVFDLLEANQNKPSKKKLSKLADRNPLHYSIWEAVWS